MTILPTTHRPRCSLNRARSKTDALKALQKNDVCQPNCSTAQLVLALAPLHAHAKIKRVVIATYQSVSGAEEAMDELFEQTRAVFVMTL